MDTYQAIYDAVRSKISNGDIGSVVERVAREAFDLGNAAHEIRMAANYTAEQTSRPSVLFNPKISIDGNQYCALLGDNLMDGVAGFGDTLAAAFLDFDKNFERQTAPAHAA